LFFEKHIFILNFFLLYDFMAILNLNIYLHSFNSIFMYSLYSHSLIYRSTCYIFNLLCYSLCFFLIFRHSFKSHGTQSHAVVLDSHWLEATFWMKNKNDEMWKIWVHRDKVDGSFSFKSFFILNALLSNSKKP